MAKNSIQWRATGSHQSCRIKRPALPPLRRPPARRRRQHQLHRAAKVVAWVADRVGAWPAPHSYGTASYLQQTMGFLCPK